MFSNCIPKADLCAFLHIASMQIVHMETLTKCPLGPFCLMCRVASQQFSRAQGERSGLILIVVVVAIVAFSWMETGREGNVIYQVRVTFQLASDWAIEFHTALRRHFSSQLSPSRLTWTAIWQGVDCWNVGSIGVDFLGSYLGGRSILIYMSIPAIS